MLIDSNIFLEFLLKQDKSDKCKDFFQKVVDGDIQAFLSSFNLDSIIMTLGRENISSKEIAEFVESFLFCKGLHVYNVTFNDRLLALELMDKYDLDYEDALTLQSAISTKSKEIVSFDKHFDDLAEAKRIEP